MFELKLTPRVMKFGSGIYEAGDTSKCYVRLFVTDTGFVLPVNRRVLTEDDLLDVYERGYKDGLAAAGKTHEDDLPEGPEPPDNY